jgi:hypothetical protein
MIICEKGYLNSVIPYHWVFKFNILGKILNFYTKKSKNIHDNIKNQTIKSYIKQQVSSKNKTNVQIILNIVEVITLITLVLYLT